eukprot:SAG11_NODE_1910_length_4079_cov_3.969095_6_plen_58_part_00
MDTNGTILKFSMHTSMHARVQPYTYYVLILKKKNSDVLQLIIRIRILIMMHQKVFGD